MNELQWERFENLVSDPYTWVFFIFIMSLSYILQYLRRFYPKSLREKMEKEEACNLEYQKKPEMKLVRKIILFGLLFSIIISYLITYNLLQNLGNKIETFRNILLGIYIPIILTTLFYEYKTTKDKNCNDVIVGYKFIKWVGMFLLVTFVILSVIVVINEFR